MTTENTTGTGSYAMSKTHSLVRQDLIDNDKKMVEQSMNKLIRLICEKRFGTLESYPYFVLYEESFIDKTAAETASILLQNPNLKLTAKFYERFGLGQDEFELIEGAPQSAPTMNESNNVNEFAETNKNIIKIAEQNEKITDLIDLLTTDSKFGANMQFNSMNDLLKSVFDVVNNADSYDDILNNLPAQFKEMNSKKFNEFMTKILMISNIHGRNAINREVQ
jgi:phage gp29-like protein